MRITKWKSGSVAVATAFVMAVPVNGLVAADSGRMDVAVTKGGAPATGIEIALNAANMGKVALATTDAQGKASFALSAANMGKARVQVVAEECPSGDRVWLVGPDGKLPPEQTGCSRKVAGVFIWGEATRLSVDVARGTAVAADSEASHKSATSNRKLGLALVGAGAAVTIFGLATKSKEEGVTDCSTQGESACSTRTAVAVAGLAIAAAGGFILYRNSRSSAAITFPAGGVGIQQRIRF